MKTDKIYRYFLAGLVLLLTFGSCKNDDLLVYDDDNDVFFTLQRWDMPRKQTEAARTEFSMEYDGKNIERSWAWTYACYDSLYVTTFYHVPQIDRDTVYLPLSYMGTPKPYKRDVAYEIVETSTAGKDVDFKILDAFIPANATKGAIVVEVLRNGLGSEGVKHLDLHLLANDEFTTQYNTTKRDRTTEELVSMIDFRLTMSNDVLPPYDWGEGSVIEMYVMGKYSKKKFLLLLEKSGADPALFYHKETTRRLTPERWEAYASRLDFYLQAENAAGRTVLDEDGEPMTLAQ
ncbi:DUF4843 domain-containing protein [Alistipes sp. OttesenSCG-928-B03]|nr:DUF4843 domain-containing protein [Alistipes sp. OttesenSCG-928-B03]